MSGQSTPRPGVGAVRTFNKHILNPIMMKLAGRKHWYAAALHHTGRRSGKSYTTPIVAAPVSGGFVVPLPYGTAVDWLRNVLAAGEATLDDHSQRYHVVDPQVVDADVVLPLVSADRRRVWKLLRVEKYLRVSISLDKP